MIFLIVCSRWSYTIHVFALHLNPQSCGIKAVACLIFLCSMNNHFTALAIQPGNEVIIFLFLFRHAGFTRIPDKEIIKNLADDVQKKWKKIGLALNLDSRDLKKWEGKHFRESFALMLSLWERKGKTYAWSALFKALSSVGEKAVADELIGE